MKSIKNHFSLIVALFAILFSIQILVVNNRAIDAYETKLSSDYSMIVVANNDISTAQFQKYSTYITSAQKLSPAKIIAKLKQNISQQNLQLLEVSMPRFYRLHFDHYPTPHQIKTITTALFQNSAITKVQDFSKSYNSTFKLLLLFKLITQIFTITILIVTTLLIIKEMRIWQFKHTERMNIMGLFGAPIWLRSAVLFRLAIVDALIASALTIISFYTIAHTNFMKVQLANIAIHIQVFKPLSDGLILSSIAIILSILLASIIMIGYKEEI